MIKKVKWRNFNSMGNKILYFECFSGISGDMTIAALLDLGIENEYLVKELDKLNLKEYSLEISKGIKKGRIRKLK